MSPHDSIRELLPLAVAGALDAGEERRVREHVRDCPACAAELEDLRIVAETLRQLPGSAPSPELLARTQAVAAAELATLADRRWADVFMGAAALLGWTGTFAAWAAWRAIGGGAPALMSANWTNVAGWLGATTVFAWMTAGAAVVMLGRNGRLGRNES